MATTKHGLANGHKVRNGVVAITDELDLSVAQTKAGYYPYFLEVACDESLERCKF
jgi:hypothetical protein